MTPSFGITDLMVAFFTFIIININKDHQWPLNCNSEFFLKEWINYCHTSILIDLYSGSKLDSIVPRVCILQFIYWLIIVDIVTLNPPSLFSICHHGYRTNSLMNHPIPCHVERDIFHGGPYLMKLYLLSIFYIILKAHLGYLHWILYILKAYCICNLQKA